MTNAARSGRTPLRRCVAAFLAVLCLVAACLGTCPVVAGERDGGVPTVSRVPGFDLPRPPQAPMFPVLPGTVGPVIDEVDGRHPGEQGSGDAPSAAGVASPAAASSPREAEPAFGESADPGAETVALMTSGRTRPGGGNAFAAWPALLVPSILGLGLLGMLAVGVRLVRTRADLQPVSVVRDPPPSRGRA